MFGMRQVMDKLKQKKWIIIGASSAVLLLYCGLYLHFRINHIFIHRAGGYAANLERGRPKKNTNHFIEPGIVAYGSQVFASVLFAAAAESETNDLNEVELDKMLENSMRQVKRAEERRNMLFILFMPAALLETVFWKIVDSNPLAREHQ